MNKANRANEMWTRKTERNRFGREKQNEIDVDEKSQNERNVDK